MMECKDDVGVVRGQVLPWLEINSSLALGRIQAGEEAVLRSRENRRLRYQGLPRNIHRYLPTYLPT